MKILLTNVFEFEYQKLPEHLTAQNIRTDAFIKQDVAGFIMARSDRNRSDFAPIFLAAREQFFQNYDYSLEKIKTGLRDFEKQHGNDIDGLAVALLLSSGEMYIKVKGGLEIHRIREGQTVSFSNQTTAIPVEVHDLWLVTRTDENDHIKPSQMMKNEDIILAYAQKIGQAQSVEGKIQLLQIEEQIHVSRKKQMENLEIPVAQRIMKIAERLIAQKQPYKSYELILKGLQNHPDFYGTATDHIENYKPEGWDGQQLLLFILIVSAVSYGVIFYGDKFLNFFHF